MRKLKRTNRMVRVIGSPTVHDLNNLICFVITVGVLEPNQSRLIGHEYAAVKKLETRWAMQFVIKRFAFVGCAVAVRVFKNQETIVWFLVARTPLGIGWHT